MEKETVNIYPFWGAFSVMVMKAIPPLLVAWTIALVGGGFATYTSVNKLIDIVTRHELELVSVKKEIKDISADSLRREQLTDLIELALLRDAANLKAKKNNTK